MATHKPGISIHRLSGPVGLSDSNNRTDVAKIETLLALAGALDIDKTEGPTGDMGHRMDQGIKTFQKDRGLQVDGRLDPQGETIRALAQNLQDMGRRGDTILAHITPLEAQLLHNITDGGTVNPVTGLPEFFLGDLFSGPGDSFSGGLSDFADSFSKDFGSFSDVSNPRVVVLEDAGLKMPMGRTRPFFPTPVNGPANKMGNRRNPTGTTPPLEPARTARQNQNIATFHKQSAERLGRQNMLQKPATLPTLSDEAISSNGRLADSLSKTNDFTAIKKHITPGLEKADPKAIAETNDLIGQMNKASPGHGDKLGRELGLDTSKTNLMGGAGDDLLQSSKQPSDALKNAQLKIKSIPPGNDVPGKGYESSIHDEFRKQLAGKESEKDGYKAFNPNAGGIGALGKYQLRQDALMDAGFFDKGTKKWTGKGGVKSAAEFLNNPEAQERAFVDAMRAKQKNLKNLGVLKTQGQVFRGVKGTDIKITEAGLIAAAHREGQSRVGDYINHIRKQGWKSDAANFPNGTGDSYLKVETRLRQFQNTRLRR
jgi:hypothetical protein